jgi:hypothetical protein
MTLIPRTQQRLRHAAGLPAILAAGYDAFEDMLLAVRAHEDPAGGLFAAFMMAAAAAADGRDALGFAVVAAVSQPGRACRRCRSARGGERRE